jgi:hypothetical protein
MTENRRATFLTRCYLDVRNPLDVGAFTTNKPFNDVLRSDRIYYADRAYSMRFFTRLVSALSSSRETTVDKNVVGLEQ